MYFSSFLAGTITLILVYDLEEEFRACCNLGDSLNDFSI